MFVSQCDEVGVDRQFVALLLHVAPIALDIGVDDRDVSGR